MAEEVKDVSEVVPEQEVPVVEESTPQETPQEEAVEPSTQEVKPEVKDNRPVENVAWEVKRKLDETIPNLQNKIEELSNLVREQRSPSTPSYTKAQLQAYASDPTTTTEQRLWAYTEVDKIEKTDRQKEYETLVTSTRQKTEAETRRSQSANWVANSFPDTVVKDQMGNTIGWNNQSPVLNKINEYMSRDETLRNHPEGFMMAAKAAAFDLGITPTSNKKLDRTIGQLRKEQKKQLASVGGTRPVETSDVVKKNRIEKLREEYSRTGSREVFAEMVKMKGLNPYV
jgi:hypothetical protein